jgi:peptidoglycan glycosyltransferase
MGRRIRWLGIVLILCFALVLIQLTNLQFRRAHQLASASANPRNQSKILDNARGDIVAADGSILAYSRALNIPGSYKYQRVYPTATARLFSDVVGYDSIKYGTWGIEYQYNDQLIAHAQPARSLSQFLNPTTATDDVTLTVQPKLQLAAQQALAGRDGAIVALNPNTGAVLAMYANPTYDPNLLASTSPTAQDQGRFFAVAKDSQGYDALASLAYAQRWAPGSTFKVITTSAAYDYAPQFVNKSYPVRPATPLPDSNLLLHNDGGTPCGGTIAQMLPPSCDPGYADLGLDIGGTNLYKQATQFGYDSVPPLDIPGVVASNFPTPAELKDNLPGVAYSAIGQEDVAATALQGALEASAIANGGVIMTPHLMAQIRDSQGNLVTNFGLKPWMRATTQATAAAITPLMEEVVTSGTAGHVGFLPEDQVAAKTGTAQAGPTNAQVDAWMIAFAPASQPRVAIAVILPDQPGEITGAVAAGPVMKAMIEAALAMTGPLPPASPVPKYAPPIPTTTTPIPTTTTPIPTTTTPIPTTTTPIPTTTTPIPTTTSPPTT